MHLYFVCRLMQVMSPVSEHFAQPQKFPIIHILVSLCLIHGFGEEHYWMEDVLFVMLHQYCSHGIIGCINFDFEWFHLIGLDKDWFFAD
jgi:hypothetical protein